MSRLLIIGCGGVAQVAIRKCCQNSEVFTDIMIASRTLSKCDDLKANLEGKTASRIETARGDADNVEELKTLIRSYRPDAVLNVALPYQDLTIMEACLKSGVNYLDTANYEPKDVAHFEYSWQWAYHERFKEAGLTAILGCGFDPGVSGIYTAYAAKHYFDEIQYLDIVDCNAGNHHKAFATNFNPEINLREVSANGSYWENGHWVETEPMEIKREYNFPQVGEKDMYLLHHEEIESLAKNIYCFVIYQLVIARKDGSVYLVDVTIYPINLFAQTSSEVTAYVDTFNNDVKAGTYNDYSLTDYETLFSQGLIDILNAGCENMSYADPQVITVEIIEDGNKYYISDRDFMQIDAAMISSAIVTETATSTDAN